MQEKVSEIRRLLKEAGIALLKASDILCDLEQTAADTPTKKPPLTEEEVERVLGPKPEVTGDPKTTIPGKQIAFAPDHSPLKQED